jgi:hypothetical protein
MPDEKPSDDPEAIEYLEHLRDQPLPVGSIAALAALARQGKLDDAIRESKSTPGYDGETTSPQVEPSAQEAEREQTEAIKDAKSGGHSVRPFENALKDVAETVEKGLSAIAGFPTVPIAPGEPTLTHASTLEKYWSEDPLIRNSPGVADRAVQMREDAERAAASGKRRARKKTAGKTTPMIGVTIEKQPYTLPHWAQWIAWTVGLLALAAAIIAIAVTVA